MIELWCRIPALAPTRILLGSGIAATLETRLRATCGDRSFHVVTDRRIGALHPGTRIGGSSTTEVDGGEALKSFAELETVLRALVHAGIDRHGVVVALGGGTVGDLAGLAAGLHLRGVDLLMIPTTLLAMVDSSVGGKTAVNLPEGKNLAGLLWPAREVWIDPDFVTTLPESEWRSGLGEVLKIAIGLDAELFTWLESHRDALLAREPAALAHAIEAALRAKIRIVEADPREFGARRLLNLGHTLGHALEAWSGFTIPHGVAVARGIHHALDVATSLGHLERTAADRSHALLDAFGFPREPLPPSGALRGFLERDKKRAGAQIHAVLPTAIGSAATVPLAPAAFLP